jgi:tetratricopeptide (TPR) repeat protein
VEFPLLGTAQRRVLLIASFAAAALVCFQAIKNWVADYRIHSPLLQIMERGAALEPGNAEAWDRLGRFEQWDFASPDPNQAIAYYLKAVQRDPRSAHYWMDLASAYETVGNTARARESFAHARNAYPVSAEVAWNYGNFLLRQQEFSEGYAEIQQAVRTDPSLLPLAISRAWRSHHDVNDVLDKVLPPNEGAYFEALDFFASNQQLDAALKVWRRLVALGKPFALDRSFPFIDALISGGRADDVRHVWREAVTAAGKPHQEPAAHSLIWNGDFAQNFTNGGLDWRWSAPLGVSLDFDSALPSHGARTLRLEFSGGANLNLEEPLQYVPVESGRTYHFRAYLRTQGITTESGMRFSIYDPQHSSTVNVRTENLTGTNPWAAVDTDVTAGPETHFLAVRLLRTPSRLFENRLSGTVWLADISLVPSRAAAEFQSR